MHRTSEHCEREPPIRQMNSIFYTTKEKKTKPNAFLTMFDYAQVHRFKIILIFDEKRFPYSVIRTE